MNNDPNGKDLGRDSDAEYREQKLKTDSGIREDLKEAADNAEAAARAVGKKVRDAASDFDAEYKKEKSKARAD